MSKIKAKRIECDFCGAMIVVPVLREEEGFCPECGEDLNHLLPKLKDNRVDEDDDDDE